MIVTYQHTPHRELGGMTPHQKWLEGLQFGPPLAPPLTPAVERLFWRMSPETRVISSKGVCAFGLHYWSPELSGAQRVGLDGRPVQYHFHYEPADISRWSEWACEMSSVSRRLNRRPKRCAAAPRSGPQSNSKSSLSSAPARMRTFRPPACRA
jgi:hypothetical protein